MLLLENACNITDFWNVCNSKKTPRTRLNLELLYLELAEQVVRTKYISLDMVFNYLKKPKVIKSQIKKSSFRIVKLNQTI